VLHPKLPREVRVIWLRADLLVTRQNE